MRMLRVAAGIIAALLVVTLASAALLSHYVSITGTVTVLAPEPEVNTPNHIADCIREGWRDYTRLDGSSFENMGRCVSYVATMMCKDDSWRTLTHSNGSPFVNQGQCVSYFAKSSPRDRPGRDIPDEEERSMSGSYGGLSATADEQDFHDSATGETFEDDDLVLEGDVEPLVGLS